MVLEAVYWSMHESHGVVLSTPSMPHLISVRNNTPFWKGLCIAHDTFRQLTRFKIGNRRSFSFWKDCWLPNQPLKDLYPQLYKLSANQNSSAANGIFEFQNLKPVRFLFTSRLTEEITTLGRAFEFTALSEHADALEWWWFMECKFSTKRCYKVLQDGGIRPLISTIVWKIWIPKKAKLFVWLSANSKILTKANLLKRGWAGNGEFTLCGNDFETNDYLLLVCPFSKMVWPKLLSYCWQTSSLLSMIYGAHEK